MAVEIEAVIHAALQDILDDEIEGLQLRQIVSPGLGCAAVPKHFQHTGFCRLFGNGVVPAVVERDDADVQAVALVAGASMGDLVQWNLDKVVRGHLRSPASRGVSHPTAAPERSLS